MQNDRTWRDVVAEALEQLGGEAHLDEITQIALTDPKAASNQRVAEKVRQVVRAFELFQPVHERSGVYRLNSPAVASTTMADGTAAPQSVTDEIQGMLMAIGKLYGYSVFAPADDRTKRRFNGLSLAALADIKTDLEPIFGQQKYSVVQRIDVIWFDEDEIGLFPRCGFEVERSTPIHTGLNRLAEIPRRFNTRLFIIGDDAKDKVLFDNLLTQNVYKPLKAKVAFQDFADVRALYQTALNFDRARHNNDSAMNNFGVEMAQCQQ